MLICDGGNPSPCVCRGRSPVGSGGLTSSWRKATIKTSSRRFLERAWPGTLNVDVVGEALENYLELRIHAGLDDGESESQIESIRIAGFERDGRSFGGATAFPAEISTDGENWVDCAILIPDLTRHTETAEVISSAFLRERLPCEDGESVTLRLG